MFSKEDRREMNSDLAYGMGVGTKIFVWLLVLSLGGAAVNYLVMPLFVHQETKIIRQSNSYITSKQSALATFKADYDNLEVRRLELQRDPANREIVAAVEGQQAGLIRQMQQEAQLIPNEVPDHIRQFLAGR